MKADDVKLLKNEIEKLKQLKQTIQVLEGIKKRMEEDLK